MVELYTYNMSTCGQSGIIVGHVCTDESALQQQRLNSAELLAIANAI